MKKRKIDSFKWAMLRVSLIPVFILTLVIASLSAKSFANSMNHEVMNGLQDMCNTIITMYDMMYEGEYSIIEQDGAIYLFKGEHLLNGNNNIIDTIKQKADVDITLFFQDTRVNTTLFRDGENRLIGTKASAIVARDVLVGKQPAFYPSVDIDGERYFAYYTPILDDKGESIGMFCVGKPSKEVERLISQSITPLIIISVLAMLVTALFTLRYSGQLTESIEKIEVFLERVSNGNLHTEFDKRLLKREDELGEMSRYVVKMQNSLRELVEQDILTGLNNRRSAEKLLRQIQYTNAHTGMPFCVAIGDIDFFKRVNDTYGHECGDMVLIEISSLLKRHMRGHGFVARWGGEEFLLVFENMELSQAVDELENLLDEIRELVVHYKEDNEIKVTMTFGISAGGHEKIDYTIRSADNHLYHGKNSGRNQIVYEDVS